MLEGGEAARVKFDDPKYGNFDVWTRELKFPAKPSEARARDLNRRAIAAARAERKGRGPTNPHPGKASWWRVAISYREGGAKKTAMFATKAATSSIAAADVRKQLLRMFPGASAVSVTKVIAAKKPVYVGRKPVARKNPSSAPVASNPSTRCPFKAGQRVTADQWEEWLRASGQRAALAKFRQGIALQKKANGRLGSVLVADEKQMGVAPGTTLVHYGSTDETTYKPPKGSIKGRSWYRHEWGEGSGKKKRVPIFVDSGGKKIVIPLGKGQKAGDWLRG